MYTQTVLLALLAAVAEARFGQEQGNGAIAAIGDLTDLGSPGQAATLAGGSIQFLLAAANPCGKLTQADQIIAELGTSDAAIAAARGLVAAEQNFNPFVVSIPSICSDPTLPTTVALRGVVPLIDPAVGGEALENANSNTSIVTPFDATGLSVAQVMVAQGFSNFTAVAVDGTSVAASTLGGASGANANTTSNSIAPSAIVSSVANVTTSGSACGASTTFVTVTKAAAATVAASTNNTSGSSTVSVASGAGTAGVCTGSGSQLSCTSPSVGFGAVTSAVQGNFPGFVASTISGLDFGLCVPTIKFEAGLDGRATTESTFQGQDPLINKGQEEALNPTIITTQITNQLTNVCGANAAAKSAAAAAGAMVASLGTRDASTADAWNTALGFAGISTNPDNAPVTGLVGHA
ncbi:hypothetical protein B7494_g6860 [Chlorociboria aeruginascens]|nr:hypothetical protein B7494_g6860 [Chlorociboria aeruginascens]